MDILSKHRILKLEYLDKRLLTSEKYVKTLINKYDSNDDVSSINAMIYYNFNETLLLPRYYDKLRKDNIIVGSGISIIFKCGEN